ncbi:MAG: patatin-like phospholipase family protein [Sulfuricella sp.]|nr:patatin-like phospholipase family protein [Sulfuricella sp.]
MQLSALAFSGGGIRSAVFNLGFIQGLAKGEALHVFDYLSTVSGGGYIGGWLSALHFRRAAGVPAGEEEMKTLQRDLASPGREAPGEQTSSPGFPPPECPPVRFVRRYSNYLTPRLGLSGDTLALVSLMVRNVTVMQLLLVSMLAAIFAFFLVLKWAGGAIESGPVHVGIMATMISVLLYKALRKALSLQKTWHATENQKRNPSLDITLGVLAPVLGAGICTALLLTRMSFEAWGGWSALGAALLYLVAWWRIQPPQTHKDRIGVLGGAVTLGALFFAVFFLSSASHALAYAPFATMVVFSLVLTVHLALAGSAITEQIREWWARLGGQGMFMALGWLAAFLFLLFVPPLMQFGWDKAVHWLIAGGGLWTALTWMGTRIAQGSDTGGSKSKLPLEILVAVVPWMFLAGLLGLVAWLFVMVLPGVDFGGETLAEAIRQYQAQLAALNAIWPAGILFGAALLFGILVRHVDLNLFSAHSFYVNRLARTFLGASQEERHPDPYTGFDPADDLGLAQLAGQRPIPLINATLNLTGGEDLAWQTRRGACFSFTPCYAGYASRDSRGKDFGGFRPTGLYGGGLTLATTVAVSGAAASPNMGFHTATSVAALLTAFNLRLARWCPNPEKGEWDQSAPKTATKPLFAELFGDTSGKNAWVNLSDGGHFENLGLYELIRRRVALIIVTDVAADGEYRFDDLAMAVRKIAVDFGVQVEIAEDDLDAIRPKADKGADKDAPRFSRKHWAFGRIRYPDGNSGYLIYVKSAIAADAPVDIRQYYDANPAFPHESTADQWFDEDQFEAYRHLGQLIAEKLLDELPPGKTGDSASQRIAALYHHVESALAPSRLKRFAKLWK